MKKLSAPSRTASGRRVKNFDCWYYHRVLSRAYPLVYPLARYLQLSLPAELYADIEQEAGREELCAWVLGVQQQPQPPTETQRKRWTDRPPAATPITIHEVCTRLAYWHSELHVP